MDFHKGRQTVNGLRYFLYLTKEPTRHLNVKVLALLHDTCILYFISFCIDGMVSVLNDAHFCAMKYEIVIFNYFDLEGH